MWLKVGEYGVEYGVHPTEDPALVPATYPVQSGVHSLCGMDGPLTDPCHPRAPSIEKGRLEVTSFCRIQNLSKIIQ